MTKKELLYEGKAKKVFATEDDNLLKVSYKDDATAFNGLKKGTIVGKGIINNRMSNLLMQRLEKNDILVTKFTDTGWTSKFSKLSGIVTEFGGILCHTAIVSREYGIPCIVCAHDVMNKIKDGELITINGTTGEIKIEKQK